MVLKFISVDVTKLDNYAPARVRWDFVWEGGSPPFEIWIDFDDGDKIFLEDLTTRSASHTHTYQNPGDFHWMADVYDATEYDEAEGDLTILGIYATIEITSTPPGASLFFDGEDSGETTPYTWLAPEGYHEILYKLDGYEDFTYTGYYASNGVIPQHADLVPISQDIKETIGWQADVPDHGVVEHTFYLLSYYAPSALGGNAQEVLDNWYYVAATPITTPSMSRYNDTIANFDPLIPGTYSCVTMIAEGYNSGTGVWIEPIYDLRYDADVITV